MQVFTSLWFSALLVAGIICRTGFLCCIDFLPFLRCILRVYRLDFVKGHQVFQVNTSLFKQHQLCALDVQPEVSLLFLLVYIANANFVEGFKFSNIGQQLIFSTLKYFNFIT